MPSCSFHACNPAQAGQSHTLGGPPAPVHAVFIKPSLFPTETHFGLKVIHCLKGGNETFMIFLMLNTESISKFTTC